MNRSEQQRNFYDQTGKNVLINRRAPNSDYELEFLLNFIKSCPGYIKHITYDKYIHVKFHTREQADYAELWYPERWYEDQEYKYNRMKAIFIGMAFVAFGMFNA
jgi:hypothetical protein